MLNERLLYKYSNYVKFSELMNESYRNLSVHFVRHFSFKVDWDKISKFTRLTFLLLDEFKFKLNWKIISKHKK